MFDFKILFSIIFIIISDESRYVFLFGGPTMDIQNNWRPIENAQRFSMAHPKSLRPTLAVTLWPVQQGQISCSTNQRICLHFRSPLITMQETRNLHQGELENIAVFSGFREIQF
jgi:hypothetical protein